MPESIPSVSGAERPRLRGIVTAIVLIMISIMIVRDILLRRWNASPPSPSNVTERSR